MGYSLWGLKELDTIEQGAKSDSGKQKGVIERSSRRNRIDNKEKNGCKIMYFRKKDAPGQNGWFREC